MIENAKRMVLIFKETLLPPSETFILGQLNSLTSFKSCLVGLNRTPISLPLPEQSLLLSDNSSRYADLRAKLYRRVALAPRFHSALRQLQPKLAHAHFASGGNTIMPLTRQLRIPLIVTLHGGSDVPAEGRNVGIYRKLAAEATLFICVSEFIRKEAVRAGYPPEKLYLHYTGIDRSSFTPVEQQAAEEDILFVGRLVEMKGCEYLLRAMARVQSARRECGLTIIGDGPLKRSLISLSKTLQLRCVFMGTQDAVAVRKALKKTRVLCVPSVTASNGDTEGLGMVFAEAQAMGIPVVSTLHGGIPEIVINGLTGILVPERNSEALAAALVKLLEDDALRQRLGMAGQEHVRNAFDLSKQTSGLEDIYRSTCAD